MNIKNLAGKRAELEQAITKAGENFEGRLALLEQAAINRGAEFPLSSEFYRQGREIIESEYRVAVDTAKCEFLN